MGKILSLVVAASFFCLIAVHADTDLNVPPSLAADVKQADPYTLVGPHNFMTGYPPVNDDGTVNMVVEIPAGTLDKWEVKKNDGLLHRDFKDGKPRIVKYLGYPCNYGMVPQTVLSKELGGDGDPLDVLLLGASEPRGAVVKTRIIGVAKFIDGGAKDDKLLVVRDDTPFADVANLVELNKKFPGITTIIETWFLNYKGPGVFKSEGFRDVDEAWAVLKTSIESFQKEQAAIVSAK